MQTPLGVHSVWQLPQHRLHWQTVMPFQVQVQQQRLPASERHRFCSVAQATSSSQTHWILQPPAHFSNLSVQRGTAQYEGAEAGLADAPGAVACDVKLRSRINVLDMWRTPFRESPGRPPSEPRRKH